MSDPTATIVALDSSKSIQGIVSFDGVEVHFDSRSRRVFWMSDWLRCDELYWAGYLERKFYPYLYGHTDYYVPPQ